MRRVFVELLDEEKERLARENGPDLEYVGLLRRCMYGTMDASAHWQGHQAHGFVQGLGNPSLFVHVERDVRLLVHGDDFMVEMSTLKRNGSKASCSRPWKVHGEVPFRCNTAMEASFLHRVIQWVPTPGRAELEADTRHVAMVLGDLGLEKSTPVVTLVANSPTSEELALLAGAKPLNAEYTTL